MAKMCIRDSIQAVRVLEQHGVRGALMEAVEAAYVKSQQLGEIN